MIHRAGRAALLATALMVAAPAAAADLYWNGAAASGSAAGGSGAWSTTATTWETLAVGGVPAAWTNGDNGVFGGTAGTVDLQSSVVAGVLTGTTTGYTLSSANDSGLAVSRIDISALGASGELNVGVRLTGTGALALAGAGDTTPTGNSNASLGIRLTNAGNDFLGDVTLTDRLVSYTSDGAFGDPANAIVMNGGGLLDNNVSVNLSRAIQVGPGGGIIRLWNASTPVWSGAVTGTGAIARTDTGVLTLAGDLSGYGGTFTQAGYAAAATLLTGTGTVGGNWVATNGRITFAGSGDQSAGGVFGGGLGKSGTGVLTLTSGSIGGNWQISPGGGVAVDGGGDQTMTGVISGSGPLTKAGPGTLTMTARSTLAGPVTVTGGTLRLNDGRSLSGSMTVAAGATLALENNSAGGYYQPAALDLTDAAVVGIQTAGNRYHGIYTEVLDIHGTGSSSVAVPVFMNKTGDANPHTLAVTVDAGAGASISGPIANHPDVAGGSLAKAGGGTLSLSGASTFTGDVTIAAGVVAAARTANSTNPVATALGNMTTVGRTISIARGATLTFVSADAIGQYNYATPVTLLADGGTITRQYTSTDYFNSLGPIVLRNGGHLTSADGKLGIVQSFALNGTVTVDGTTGSFIDTNGLSFTGLHLGTVGGSTLFDVADTGGSAADLTVSAALVDKVLGGAAVLVKAGAGRMRMTVANSYSGGTTLRAGTLIGAVTDGFGTGPITINDGATGDASTDLLVDASGDGVTVSQAITVAAAGAGVTTIGSLANAGGNFASFSGPLTLARDVTLVSAAGGDRTEFTGGISGTGGVTIGTAAGSRLLLRGAANTYAGDTTILVASTLQLGDASPSPPSYLPDSGAVVVNGTLRLAIAGGSETIGPLRGGGTVESLAGGATLVVGEGGGSGTFAGSLRDAGGGLALVKTGGGVQTLGGSNAHTGATTVSQGTLRLASPAAAATSTVAVAAGGTAQVADYLVTSVGGLDLTGGGLVDVTRGGITVLGGLGVPGLLADLLAGRGDGSWTGSSGITSSAAATAAAASQPRTVGWLDNGDGSVTAAFAAPGDTNLDWNVDILDAANFFAGGRYDTGLPASWSEGDFSYDGLVDILDAADFVSTGLFDSGSYNTPPPSSGVAAVPEPAAGALVATALAAGFLRSRRGRRGQGRPA